MSSKISIVIPAYNRCFYLEKTIASIQNQGFDNYEIVVVDDGSTDDTKEMMNRLCQANEKIRYFYIENSGRSTARNLGIENSVGEWLLFLDSDDLLEDDALLFLAEKMRDYPEAEMIGGTYVEVDENDNLIDQTVAQKMHGSQEGMVNDPYLNLIRKFYIPMGSYIVRREVVKSGGNFDSEFEPCEDYDFCLRMARRSRCLIFKKPIAKIRKHGGNTPLDMFYKTSIRVACKNLAEIKGDASIKNKRLIISDWRNNIANDLFNQGKFKTAFYNYSSSAFYNPKKFFNRAFCKQILWSLSPKPLKRLLKNFLRNSSGGTKINF